MNISSTFTTPIDVTPVLLVSFLWCIDVFQIYLKCSVEYVSKQLKNRVRMSASSDDDMTGSEGSPLLSHPPLGFLVRQQHATTHSLSSMNSLSSQFSIGSDTRSRSSSCQRANSYPTKSNYGVPRRVSQTGSHYTLESQATSHSLSPQPSVSHPVSPLSLPSSSIANEVHSDGSRKGSAKRMKVLVKKSSESSKISDRRMTPIRKFW